MINVSNEFKKQIANDNRNYLEYADITLKDGTVLNLTNKDFWQGGVSIDDAVSSENSFDIGAAIINKSTFVINNIYEDFSEYVFEDAEVVAYIGLQLSDGTIEKVRKGTYAADEAQYNGSIITLPCLDNMRKFDRAYSESVLVYPATLNAIVRDACSVCGVTLQTVSFPHDDFIVHTRPTDEAITFREVVSWAAQIAGCFCRCDVYGRLEMKWYDQTALENPSVVDWSAEDPSGIENAHWIRSNYSAPVVALDDTVITGVRVVEKNESAESQEELTTYQAGSNGYVVSIENNELIKNGDGQTVVSWIGEQLIGIRFRKATISHASDPTIEAGDVALLTDRKGNNYNVLVSSTSFNTGSAQNTISAAETPTRNSAARYSAQTKNYVEWRKAVRKEKTEREKALEELGERLKNSPGVFTTVQTQSDGSKVYYLHNKPNLSESDMIWKMTAEAWGVSTDGGKTWNAGMTVDGDTIVRILTATGVNADWIDTGAITIKDDNGKIIFSVNMDTGQIIMNADSITIGDKILTDEIQDLKNSIASSGNITLNLTNDYQLISTDENGNYEVFPEGISTTATVLYNITDITSQCVFTVAKSDGLSGNWNNAEKTFTVTGITASESWVDITAVYLDSLSVTKRFKVVKLIGGKPGSIYFMESSANTVTIKKDNVVVPGVILFAGYRREGDEEREPYAGKFVIEETADGENYNTVYESVGVESSTTYLMYMLITNAAGELISDANGNVIGTVKKNIMAIRCSFYSPDGVLIDQQTLNVVKDADALTSDEVFDMLTNFGTVKGIYKVGDQLLINADYIKTGTISANLIKGGTLRVGGEDNINGKIVIYDEEGNKSLELWGKGGRYYREDQLVGLIGVGTMSSGEHGLSTSLNGYNGEYIAWTSLNYSEEYDIYGESYIARLIYATKGIGNPDSGSIKKHGLYLGDNLYTRCFPIYFSTKSYIYGGEGTDFISVRPWEGGNFYVSIYDSQSNTYIRRFNVSASLIKIGADLDMLNHSILNSSDERLKTNIRESDVPALDTVNAMKTYEFDWIKTGEHEKCGFIAQQLEQEAGDEFIHIDNDTGQYSVKTLEIIPYLVKSIQELTLQIQELKQEIRSSSGEEKISPMYAKVRSDTWQPTEYSYEEKEEFVQQEISREMEQSAPEPEPIILDMK